MFDLGNGVWVSLEHIVSVSIQPEVAGDESFGLMVVVADARNEWRVEMDDKRIWGREEPLLGLRSLGYATPQEFCGVLLAAIKDAKHG